MHVDAGEVVALRGPSGSGKTTALRCINGLTATSGGRVLLRGEDVAVMPAHVRRQRIGLVFQIPHMFPGTVAENLQQAAGYSGREHRTSDDIEDLLISCGLDGTYTDRIAVELSVGEQQRVALARAATANPEVLLLDEPTAALDADNTALVERAIQHMCSAGMAIVLVSHDQDQIQRLATRVVDLAGHSPALQPIEAADA